MARKQTIQIDGDTIKLTDREILFADHYIISNNASDAAIKAGYSERCAGQQGFENLKKPEILKYIQFKTKPIIDQLGITQKHVLQEFATIAFSNIADVFNNDWTIKDLGEIDPKKTPAIKYAERTDKGIKVHFHDKLAALNRLWELVKPIHDTNQQQKEGFFSNLNNYYSKN